MVASAAFDLKFLNEFAATAIGTSNRRHEPARYQLDSAATGLRHGVDRTGRRLLVRQPGFQLLEDLLEIFRLRLEVTGVRPLEARFEPAADPPIGVAEM